MGVCESVVGGIQISEKRFEKGYDDKGNALFIYDNQTDKMYYLEGAINLLNSLNDELEDSSAFIIEQRKENKGLREENEQLRRRVEKLQSILHIVECCDKDE